MLVFIFIGLIFNITCFIDATLDKRLKNLKWFEWFIILSLVIIPYLFTALYLKVIFKC